jgi:RNA polymerase sigma factor (sigma-70 family)
MPFRDRTVLEYIKDPNTNRVVGHTEVEKKEQMPSCFLADTEAESSYLYEQFERLVTSSASYYAEQTGLDRKDLIQEAWIGLARASRDFEPGRSSDFKIFAIYKIKEALREFVSKQEINISIPHYIKETCRLVRKLHSTAQKAGVTEQFCDYNTIWEKSGKCECGDEIMKILIGLRQSIENIAKGAQTTIEELLTRAEIYPVMVPDDEVQMEQDLRVIDEEDVMSEIQAKIDFEKIKESLTKEEFDLLFKYFVCEMSVRELAPIYNISSSHVANKITEIVNRLKKKRVLHYHEKDNTGVTTLKEGNGC